MKKLYYLLFIFVSFANAQQEKGIKGSVNWLNNWAEFRPDKQDYGQADQILAGNISQNTTLLKKNVYLLQGDVYVTNKAVLQKENELGRSLNIDDYRNDIKLRHMVRANIVELAKDQFSEIENDYKAKIEKIKTTKYSPF